LSLKNYGIGALEHLMKMKFNDNKQASDGNVSSFAAAAAAAADSRLTSEETHSTALSERATCCEQ